MDILTPLGKGQCLLLTGTRGSGKSRTATDMVLGQRGAGVRCVYAAIDHSPQQLEALVEELRGAGAQAYTTIVAAPKGELGASHCRRPLSTCLLPDASWRSRTKNWICCGACGWGLCEGCH